MAEPRLNAWAASMLGAPGQIRFSATFTGSDGVEQTAGYALDGFDLCPLDLVHLSAAKFTQTPLVELLRLKLVY